MAVREIRIFGDPVLKTPALPVANFDDRLRALVDDLIDTVDAPGRAGLAAPQIGVGLRAFSYRSEGQRGYLINPEIVELSPTTQEGEEGCLSIPGLWFPLQRARHAVVRGVNLRNQPVVVRGSNELARVLQHEVDHLDGVLYVDRLGRDVRKEAMRAIRASDWFTSSR